MARKFHELYEEAAPRFGYETRADTKTFHAETPNGRLMSYVCGEIASLVREETLDEVYRVVSSFIGMEPVIRELAALRTKKDV